jgi:TolA-binding protein
MTRLGSWILAVALLLAGSALAAAQDSPLKSSDARPGDAARLDELAKDLAALKKQAEETGALLRKMTEQLERMTDLTVQTQKNAGDLKALRDRLERLELDVARLQTDGGARRSYYGPTPLGRGTIRLENIHGLPMSVIVDGVTYTVLPNETRYVDHAAGSFSYEVPGVQAPVWRQLAVGETFVIRIYTR